MKTSLRIAALATLVMLLAFTASAQDQPTFNKELAETNLLIGVASDNLGLRLSAASILGDLGTDRSVIPLMKMLHDGNEEERIVAALSLSRLGDGRGEYAVARAVQFDPSEKVQRLAAWYYNQYVIPKPDETVTIMTVSYALPEPYPEYSYPDFPDFNEFSEFLK